MMLHGQDYGTGSSASGSDLMLGTGHHIGFAHARTLSLGQDGSMRGSRLGTESAMYGLHRLAEATALNWKLGAGHSELPEAMAFALRVSAREQHHFAEIGLAQIGTMLGGRLEGNFALRYDVFNAEAVEGEAIGLNWSVETQDYRGLTANAGAYQAWDVSIADMPVQLNMGFDYRHRFNLRGGMMRAYLQGAQDAFHLPLFATGADALLASAGVQLQPMQGLNVSAQLERDLLDEYRQSDRARISISLDF